MIKIDEYLEKIDQNLKISNTDEIGNSGINTFLINQYIFKVFELIKIFQSIMLASMRFLSHFRQPLLPILFRHTPFFMQSNERKNEDWQDLEQRAIISFYTMQEILQLRDIHHASIFSRHSIRSRIQAKVDQLKSKQQILKAWQLKEENMDKVWKGFDQNRGALVNLKIWKQTRFIDIAIDGKICLMPSFVTGQIFHQLLGPYVQQILKKDFVISGQKGIGKSFAYLIYDYLSQFILSYRMSGEYLKQPQSQRLFCFVDKAEFNSVKKLLYLPLRQISQLSSATDHFLLQTNFKQVQQLKNIGDIQRLSEIIKNFRSYYMKKHGIQLLCIIDQVNSYFSSFRQMLKFYEKAEKSHAEKLIEKKLSQKSVILDILSMGNIDNLIFNSSQSIEADLIRNWNKSGNSPQYFCIYPHDRTDNQNYYIRYPMIMENIQGHAFLYEIFWQLLWKKFNNYTSYKYRQKRQYLRTTFQKTFRLSHHKQLLQDKQNLSLMTKQKMILWRMNVTNLSIRSVCEKKQSIVPKIQQIMQNQQDEQKKSKNLLQIKQLIQKNAYQLIKFRFLKYYQQSVNKLQHRLRFQIICWINSSAYNQIVVKNRLDSQQSLQSMENIQQTNHYQNGFVEVDFSQMLKRLHLNKYDLQEVQTIKKLIFDFTEEVGVGYTNPNDPLKCRLYINSVLLWKITLLLNDQFIKDSSLQFRLLIKGFQVSHYTGNHLDSLYFRLFKQFQNIQSKNKSSAQFTLILDSWLYNEKEMDYKQNQYLIANTVGFQLRRFINGKKISKEKLVDWKVQLSNIFNAANQEKNIGKFILGFCQIKDILNEDTFSPKNPIFDFVLVKCFISKTGKAYQAHFIDSTYGQINSKIASMVDRMQSIERLVKEMKKMDILSYIPVQNLKCKFLILRTQNLVKKFIANGMNEKELTFYHEEYQVHKPGKIKINYGVRSANYLVRGRHLKLPLDKKNFENLIFSTMQEVIRQLEIQKNDDYNDKGQS